MSSMQERKENFLKTVRREPHDYVPIMPRLGTALMAYGGGNIFTLKDDQEKFRAAILKAFEDGIPADVMSSCAINITPELKELYRGCAETNMTEDGITMQHLQSSHMQPDEYPVAKADLNDFILNTLLPRKMPFLFEGTAKDAAKILEKGIDLTKATAVGPQSGLPKLFEEKYGTYVFGDARFSVTTPGDFIFDRFRGFKGTLTDLRRRYDEMQELCEVIWEQNYTPHYDNNPIDPDKSGLYMSHIPCFLNAKQYQDLCFKYFKKQVENFSDKGSHVYVLAEGNWKQLFETLRDLPKDSILMNVEDNDVTEAYPAIGDCQVLIGGSRLVTTKMCSVEECIDQVKRSMDLCAPGNAFIFGSDKSWCCKGDVTPALVEAYKYAGTINKY